ncbi:Transketolase-like pyrimidine-binding domain-containing protein [Plasmodiophora brassicae]
MLSSRWARRVTWVPGRGQRWSSSQQGAAVAALVDAYRRLGHRRANIDPLGRRAPLPTPELDPEHHALTDLGSVVGIDVNVHGLPRGATFRDLIEQLDTTYCGSVGAEFMHIPCPDERRWLASALESMHSSIPISPGHQMNMLSLMFQSELFDEFMQLKFGSFKRYGLDGSEVFLVAVQSCLARAGYHSVDDVVIGMPHRGRNNLLLTLLDYPPRALLAKVKGQSHTTIPGQIGSDDVISHIATTVTKSFGGSKHPIHVSLLHNPSHLEAVNPVALGKVRAIQDMAGDSGGDRCFAMEFHGDAAFAGQGVVTESLQLSQLRDFRTGGTVHVIVNNQIGFTTEPHRSRSGPYASDVASMIACPVFHVNGDDPEAVHRVASIAIDYRMTFKKDVIIDLLAYRKFGHNEVDEPQFTQPTMYANIRSRKSSAAIYAERLEQSGIRTGTLRSKLQQKLFKVLDEELKVSAEFKADPNWNFQGSWAGMRQASDMTAPVDTGVDSMLLRQVALASVQLPDHMIIHPRLMRSHVEARRDVVNAGRGIDWATAEAMAFGSLLHEGYNIRISGQDVQRGTFSQRHATFTDQKTDEQYTPLCHLGEDCGTFYPANSHLSEFAVLGFEFGYSWESPKNLVIWEAQFGDFWNTAQVIVDNFIATGEDKWIRQSGIVMLLPHGYDGAGPEHSSAKVERVLQLCSSDEFAQPDRVVNMSVVNCTTPSNYFHALRRQMHASHRKPLIVIAPKTILRLPEAVSTLDDMGPGSHLLPVLSDCSNEDCERVRRLAFVSGKIYYDLVKARSSVSNPEQYSIVRIEELCPFPFELIVKELNRYPQVEQVAWVQEEPSNAGCWTFVGPRLQRAIEASRTCSSIRLQYLGRKASASPAVGALEVHKKEAKSVIEALFH